MKLGFHCAFFCVYVYIYCVYVYIFSRRYCYGIVSFGLTLGVSALLTLYYILLYYKHALANSFHNCP